ncbi:MAG: hypothetical protein COY68_02840 [Candidatus Levybacteria bacterium CG_4_10_14_0_8_um_filter_35_23]|nr:MAG: hypothetical protein COY68_02840 [Candidatus Levybacteria bacterium CG_4_10_14_0_8_um_filter_35_23]
MTLFKKLLMIIIFVFVFSSSVIPAYAASSSYYSKALRYYQQVCTNKSLSSINAIAFGCYVFDKVNEINSVVTDIQTNLTILTGDVSALKTEVLGLQNTINSLNQRITDLESATPATTTTIPLTPTQTPVPGSCSACVTGGFNSTSADGNHCNGGFNYGAGYYNFCYESGGTCVSSCTP